MKSNHLLNYGNSHYCATLCNTPASSCRLAWVSHGLDFMSGRVSVEHRQSTVVKGSVRFSCCFWRSSARALMKWTKCEVFYLGRRLMNRGRLSRRHHSQSFIGRFFPTFFSFWSDARATKEHPKWLWCHDCLFVIVSRPSVLFCHSVDRRRSSRCANLSRARDYQFIDFSPSAFRFPLLETLIRLITHIVASNKLSRSREN